MLYPSPAQQDNPGSLGDTNIQDWQRLLGDWRGDGVGLSEGAGRSPVLWTVDPANVSPSGLPSRGESGADATGGGVEGGLGGHDRVEVVEKQGTQTDMLRRRGRGGGGWRWRRGINY